MVPASPQSPAQITAEKFRRMEWDAALRDRKTTTDYIAAALRVAILDGQFADGEELNQVELAKYFNVSRVPIREALRSLQSEGLVHSIAHHKTVITSLSLEEILEIIETRAVLEGYIVEKCAPQLDETAIARLAELCDEMDDFAPGHPWILKNWEFHRTLYRGGPRSMIELIERLHFRTERYSREAGSGERRAEAAGEHRDIVHMLRRRDYEGVGKRIREHVLHTGEAIRQFRARREDPGVR